MDIYRHLLRCSLMAESKRWKGRLDNQKAGSHAGLITHNICILNCHLTCDWVPWGMWGGEAGISWGPASSSQPEGLTKMGISLKTLREVNDPVSSAFLWDSWILKHSWKRTECGCGESYLGIHVSQHRAPFNSVFVSSCHFSVWEVTAP